MTDKHVARNRLAVLATVMVGAGGALAPMAPSFAATLGTCAVHFDGSHTYTLTKDCTTSQTVVVPAGDTLDGAGHTVTAVDGPSSTAFNGSAVIQSDTTASPPIAPVHLRDVHVVSQLTAVSTPANLSGVFLTDGSTARNVTVFSKGAAADALGSGLLVLSEGEPVSGSLRTSHLWNVSVHRYQGSGIVAAGVNLVADSLVVGPAIGGGTNQGIFASDSSLFTLVNDTVTVTNSQLANNFNPTQDTGQGYFALGTTTANLDHVTISGSSDDGDGVSVLPFNFLGPSSAQTGTDLTVTCSSITRTLSTIASANQNYGYGIDVSQFNPLLRTGARASTHGLRLPRLPQKLRSMVASAAPGTADVTLGGVKFANWRQNVHNAATVTRTHPVCATAPASSAVLHAHSYRVDDEKPIQFFGRILPAKFGTAVHIQRATSHGWRTVKTVGERRSGRFVASVWMRDPRPGKGVDGPRYFRAVSTAGGKQVVSKPVKITLH